MPLGDRLRDLRKKHDLTRKELADKLKLTYAALSKYETNEREPDYETLQKIANYFHVSLDYLLDFDSLINPDIDFSPLENFITEYQKLSEDDQKKAIKELLNLALEDDRKKKK